MQRAERKTLRNRITMVAFATWIVLMRAGEICFANPYTPNAPYVGTVRQYAAYAAACLFVVVITTGLYLLLWRIVTFPARRKNSIMDHALALAYSIAGLFLGQYYVGFILLAMGLIKGVRVFFEDVRQEKGKLTGIRSCVCVWCYNAVLILFWKPLSELWASVYEVVDTGGYDNTASEGVYRLFSFVHWYPSRDLIVFLVICVIWVIVLAGFLVDKGVKEFLKNVPDIITVFGLLLTGYWFWYFGGIIIYLLAAGFAMCFLSGFPAYYNSLFLPGHPANVKAIKREVAKMEAAEIIKELEDSGESVDKTLSLRELQKQLVRKRLSGDASEEKHAEQGNG